MRLWKNRIREAKERKERDLRSVPFTSEDVRCAGLFSCCKVGEVLGANGRDVLGRLNIRTEGTDIALYQAGWCFYEAVAVGNVKKAEAIANDIDDLALVWWGYPPVEEG